MKRCPGCGSSKVKTEFNKSARRADGLQVECRECQAKRHADYYQNNKSKFAAYAKSRARRMRETVDAIKSQPCADCRGEYPPWVMDFDHLDSESKSFDIGNMQKFGYGLDAIMQEIEKCEVVCANCHRQRAHDRTA